MAGFVPILMFVVSWFMRPVVPTTPIPDNEILPEHNTFLVLARTIAATFNLTNCWVCGGPKGESSWPWRARPLAPQWILSGKSAVHTGSPEWQEAHVWPIRHTLVGNYCVRYDRGGPVLGYSNCDWTLTWRSACFNGCKPYNCSRFKGTWNSTAIQLSNGTWVACRPDDPSAEYLDYGGCSYISAKDGRLDTAKLLCQSYNSTSESTVFNRMAWVWVNPDGTEKLFSTFWSVSEVPSPLAHGCVYDNQVGLWKCSYGPAGCTYCSGPPLGPHDHKYYPYRVFRPQLWLGSTAAIKGHYWICGSHAYTILPVNWTGSCYVGILEPMFFLTSNTTDMVVKVYDDLQRTVRAVDTALTTVDHGDAWPASRIIQYYGPATWAQDGSWGYRTPIYMLNRIIRLQAVLEEITNQTATALELLADQSTQMRTAILQNRLALDYLLAEEGGVCGKLNISDCCLEIDDNGEVVKSIASDIRKVAHVPVQIWKGWDAWGIGNWFSTFGGFKTLFGGVVLILGLCLILPCLLPLLIRGLQSSMERMIERRTAAHVMMLWRYRPLNQNIV